MGLTKKFKKKSKHATQILSKSSKIHISGSRPPIWLKTSSKCLEFSSQQVIIKKILDNLKAVFDLIATIIERQLSRKLSRKKTFCETWRFGFVVYSDQHTVRHKSVSLWGLKGGPRIRAYPHLPLIISAHFDLNDANVKVYVSL